MFTPTPLRIARLSKGLSQHELGAMAGISQTHVSYLEREARRPARMVIPRRIAEALGVPEDSLFA
jgi:transcriptional regulator with XRE-family HTH domain